MFIMIFNFLSSEAMHAMLYPPPPAPEPTQHPTLSPNRTASSKAGRTNYSRASRIDISVVSLDEFDEAFKFIDSCILGGMRKLDAMILALEKILQNRYRLQELKAMMVKRDKETLYARMQSEEVRSKMQLKDLVM
jgi:hypothetical protein